MSDDQITCDCGKPAESNSLQCRDCRKATIAKWLKVAAIIGALLGFICGRIPADYQKPCKTVANLLSSC